MTTVTPSMRIEVPGCRGIARPGGTSVMLRSGNMHCQALTELFRIPPAPAMAGWGTTVPRMDAPSSVAAGGAMCLLRITVPRDNTRRISPPDRRITSEGGRGSRVPQCQHTVFSPVSSEKFSALHAGQIIRESRRREKRFCHSPSVTRRSGSQRPSVNARVKVFFRSSGQYAQRSRAVA